MKTFHPAAALVASILATCFESAAAQIPPAEYTVDSDFSRPIQSVLQEPLRNGEAYVWYLLHCGYAVKTSTRLLIFDYIRSTRDFPDTTSSESLAAGKINPAEIKDLDVYVFVSHGHEDHFDPVILDWQDQIENVTYIFGWSATEDSRHHRLVGPKASLRIADMDVFTINCRSGVPEVAYLINADGLTIFFQGDYRSDSTVDVDYLMTKCDTVDMAFLGAHTRRWGDASARVIRILERIRPRVVFPMHYGGKEPTYRIFAQELAGLGLPFVIKCPGKPGTQFHYQR